MLNLEDGRCFKENLALMTFRTHFFSVELHVGLPLPGVLGRSPRKLNYISHISSGPPEYECMNILTYVYGIGVRMRVDVMRMQGTSW